MDRIYLGNGRHRIAYLDLDSGLVYKEVRDPYYISYNKQEATLWKELQGSGFEKHFLPVLEHSKDYKTLVMPFSFSLKPEDTKGVLIPYYWDDCYLFNLGRYEDRIVLRDYGDVSFKEVNHESKWIDIDVHSDRFHKDMKQIDYKGEKSATERVRSWR